MMAWGEIDIRIPTVLPDRVESLHRLVREVRDQTGQHPTVSPQPPNAPPSDRVPRIFGNLADGEWVLHLEDDVTLSPGFGDVVPRALDESSRPVVSFFSTREPDEGLTTAPKPFYWMQCVAVRADISEGFSDFYRDWIERVDHDEAADLALGEYATSIGTPIDLYTPSQVQHLPLASTLGSRSTHRQSPTFEAHYG